MCVENIIINAERVHIHPEYDDNRLRNDIAMLRLSENAPYTGKQQDLHLRSNNDTRVNQRDYTALNTLDARYPHVRFRREHLY